MTSRTCLGRGTRARRLAAAAVGSAVLTLVQPATPAGATAGTSRSVATVDSSTQASFTVAVEARGHNTPSGWPMAWSGLAERAGQAEEERGGEEGSRVGRAALAFGGGLATAALAGYLLTARRTSVRRRSSRRHDDESGRPREDRPRDDRPRDEVMR